MTVRVKRTRPVLAVLLVCLTAQLATRPASAQGRSPTPASDRGPNRYDDTFRKYSKRYFGPGYDWRVFKAQGMTESNLHALAHSRFGARGVMQLLPTTFHEIASQNPDIRRAINDPEWNIAAGISYDRRLWQLWEADSVTLHRQEFMFASYNAGRGTILGAQSAARARQLDPCSWPSIEAVAPTVPRWRWRETIGYVHRIDGHLAQLDEHGRLVVGP